MGDLSSTSIKKKKRERDKTPRPGGPPCSWVGQRAPSVPTAPPGRTQLGSCVPGCRPREERPREERAPPPQRSPSAGQPSLSSPHPRLGRRSSQASSSFRVLSTRGLPAVHLPTPVWTIVPVMPRGLDDTSFRPSVTSSGCGHSAPRGPHRPGLLLTPGPLTFLTFWNPLATLRTSGRFLTWSCFF